jgi:hypothetical protein
LIFAILLVILIVIIRYIFGSKEDPDNATVAEAPAKEPATEKSSPVIILPSALPDEEIVVENPEEGPEETIGETK